MVLAGVPPGGIFLSAILEGLLVKISDSWREGQVLGEWMWPRRETGEESREALPLEQEKWQGLSRQGCSIRLRIPLPSTHSLL